MPPDISDESKGKDKPAIATEVAPHSFNSAKIVGTAISGASAGAVIASFIGMAPIGLALSAIAVAALGAGLAKKADSESTPKKDEDAKP